MTRIAGRPWRLARRPKLAEWRQCIAQSTQSSCWKPKLLCCLSQADLSDERAVDYGPHLINLTTACDTVHGSVVASISFAIHLIQQGGGNYWSLANRGNEALSERMLTIYAPSIQV